MPRVYISATFQDLVEEREAAARAVRRLDCQPIAMEDYVACDDRPLDKCLEDVRTSEIYIGIVAWRYGYRPPDQDKSITELEYLEAGESGVERLLFLPHDDLKASWPGVIDEGEDGAAIDELRQRLCRDHTVSFFKSAQELETKITAAVSNSLLKDAPIGKIQVPPLLPYMADRSRQREQLADAIDLHRESHRRRPMIVLVHGEEREAHSAFVKRLQQVTLPELLSGSSDQQTVHLVNFDWSEPAASREERARRLQSKLAEALTGARRAEAEELAQKVASHRCPVLIASSILSADWESHEPELIGDWLDSWRSWPDLPPGQILIVVLSLLYKDTEELSFLRRRSVTKKNKAARALFAGEELSRDGLTVTVLKELQAVREGDVMSWIEDQAGKFCREARGTTRDPLVLAERMKPLVREMFRESQELTDDGHLPMEVLATELRRQLARCLTEGGA